MGRKRSKLAWLALALALSLSLSSCIAAAAVAAGAVGAYVYQSEESAHVRATPRAVVTAAYRVAGEMNLEVEEKRVTALDGRLTALTADDDRVRVDVEATEDGGCDVSVRVGFADETAARRVLDAILAKLPEGAVD